MRAALPAAALLLAATLLAGCSSSPRAPAEVVVQSQPSDDVHTINGTAQAAATPPAAKTRGHIAGVVVDQAIRPIAGARVALPGLDLKRTTDRDGGFGFVDLIPGPYYITVNATGYAPAEAVLEVKADQFTRAKVVLTAIPPPEPFHVTQKFDGFADVTGGDPFSLGFFCGTCSFTFYIDRPHLETVVLEAVGQGTAASGDGFYHSLDNYTCCAYYSSGDTGTPLLVSLPSKDLGYGDRFALYVEPTSFPVPETSKAFSVFVTAFYNQPAPTGWSFVAGDT